MARLQKKKPTDAKQKKREKKPDDIAQVASGSGSQPAAMLAKVKKTSGQKATNKPFTTTKVPAVLSKPNWVQKSIQFLREVKVELKKVTWPSRKQTLGSTIVVLVLVILISLFLGLVDMGLTSFVRVVLQ